MNKTIIIAEAGVNHNGSFDLALRLVDQAKNANVDYIKFQTFKTELNISKIAKKAKYQQTSTGIDETQFDMVKKLELSYDQFIELKKYCDKKNIGFLSTAFDLPSIDFIATLQGMFKVPSGEITNFPFLKKTASYGKPTILSTGMSNLDEIKLAITTLVNNGLRRESVTVLHCNTEYPTPFKDVNLKAMQTIENEFGVSVGYSDHTLGIEVPIAAVALGAKVIEKHFTLDRAMEGPDHSASLEPEELKEMVKSIRNIELAISGSGDKHPSVSEKSNISVARKSIHTAKEIIKGEVIQENMLIALRPGDGISPMLWNDVIGKRAIRDLEESHKLKFSDFR